MWVIVVCILLVLAGLLAVVRWGGFAVQPPPTPPPHAAGSTDPPPMSLVARRYLWYLALAVTAGFGAGILAAGAGGRLAMRLLAVTAGADAQGRITEAQQVVGRITVDGTLGFIVFTALFFGAGFGGSRDASRPERAQATRHDHEPRAASPPGHSSGQDPESWARRSRTPAPPGDRAAGGAGPAARPLGMRWPVRCGFAVG
jgi:hypothetical protein